MKHLVFLLSLVFFMEYACCKVPNPSFHTVTLKFSGFRSLYASTFRINFDSNTLTCQSRKWQNEEKELINYHVKSVIVFKKEYKVDEGTILKLDALFKKYAPHSVVSHSQSGLDGGGFDIEYVRRNNQTAKLLVTNPERNKKYETDLLQVDEFFKMAYTVVTDSIGLAMMDLIYEKYFIGLPVRKVGDDPLEYKIWGSISGDRKDNPALVEFFNQLPDQKCVIIDIGDENLCYALTELVAEYSLKKNIHFISGEYLPWLWKELNDLRTDVLEAKKKCQVLKQTRWNAVFLSVYLSDSTILNKWLDSSERDLFRTKDEIKLNCH